MILFLRSVFLAVGLGCFFFAALPPVLYRFINVGVVALFVLSGLCFAMVALVGRQKRSPWEVFAGKGRSVVVVRRVLAVVLAVFLLAEVALSAMMYFKGWRNSPGYSGQDTAVVMGAHIKGDQPSLMLQNRLAAALAYLNEAPEARVVVTGGWGRREQYSEAEIEAKWLVERGIAPERIIIEDGSKDTYENMQNTADLLSANGLPPNVVIFTDGFHQLRSQLYARLHGLSPTGISSPTPWGLLPSYWLREQAAIVEALLVTNAIPMLLNS